MANELEPDRGRSVLCNEVNCYKEGVLDIPPKDFQNKFKYGKTRFDGLQLCLLMLVMYICYPTLQVKDDEFDGTIWKIWLASTFVAYLCTESRILSTYCQIYFCCLTRDFLLGYLSVRVER